ncbi:hypothetical protein BDV12DRAFT_209219 [Aspergillus spectabilis]
MVSTYPRALRRSRFGCRNCRLRKLKCDESKPQCKKCRLFGVLCNFVLVTPDDPNMIQVYRNLLELAFGYLFLMHASSAVALTYDHYLNGSSGCRRTLEECYHCWGTAAALVILTFSYPDACTAEQAWPLNPSDSLDLDWLRMNEGKMSLWHMLNPLCPDSLFHVMAAIFAQMNSPLLEAGIDGIPSALAALCNLNNSSTAQTNPDFHAAHAVFILLGQPDSEVTTGQTDLFMRTLLLLRLWYRKAGRSIWWIEFRARLECPSICLYLRII